MKYGMHSTRLISIGSLRKDILSESDKPPYKTIKAMKEFLA
jgi:hypothetical protein